MFFKGSRSVGERCEEREHGEIRSRNADSGERWCCFGRRRRSADRRRRRRRWPARIVVAEGSTANDIACVFCDVHVHGDVKGDVAVAFGDLEVDPGHQISGDVAFDGWPHPDWATAASIGGDLAVVGLLREGEDVNIAGSRAVLPAALLLAPILLLAGVIWLIVFLVRRSRYRPTYPPGYPGRRM